MTASLADKIERPVPAWVRDLARETIVAGAPATAIAHFARLINAGLPYVIAVVHRNDLETARLLAQEVIPEVRRRVAVAGGAG